MQGALGQIQWSCTDCRHDQITHDGMITGILIRAMVESDTMAMHRLHSLHTDMMTLDTMAMHMYKLGGQH